MPSDLMAPQPASPGRKKRRRIPWAILVMVVTASLLSVAPTSWADSPGDPLAAGNAMHAADQPPTTLEDQAFAQAAASGQPVTIDALTTVFSTTQANPDGTMTQTQSPTPQRVLQNGSWVPLNATLATTSNGYAPQASSEPLTISAGGTGPLATMTGPGGQRLSLTAPFPLPAPVVSGSTALYSDVAPGIDLRVQASDTGGVSTVLIVNTAAAASNPILQNLTFTTTTEGVTVSSDAGGNLTASDAAGADIFHASAPLMWDSNTTSAPTAPSSTEQLTHSLSSVQGTSHDVDTSPSADDAPPPTTSSADGPGSGAQVATVPDSTSSSGVVLEPDQAMLTSAATQFPVYVDPSWQPTDLGLNAFTWVQSAYPSNSYLGHTGSSDTDYPAVGTCGSYPDGGGCSPSDTERTFYQFNVSGLDGTTIHSATLTIKEHSSADWSCSDTYPVSLSVAGAIDNTTTWNHQPGYTYDTQQQVGGSGDSGCGGDVSVGFDVTDKLKAATTWTLLDFAITGDESNANAFKRFEPTADIAVQYDRTPWQPQSPKTTPLEPQFASTGATTEACENSDSSQWGWIGSTSTSLNVTVGGPLANQPLAGWFNIWDDSQTNGPSIASGETGYVSEGKPVSFPLTGKLQDGHAYGWHAYSTDGLAPMSAGTAICSFRVDTTAPVVTMPTNATGINTATQFPPAGSGATTSLYAGQSGTIPYSATDPAPSNYTGIGSPQVSGLACLRWGWDSSDMSADTWQCGAQLPSSALSVTPTHWGTNILYVQAEDNAGNPSAILSYAFYVPWNPHGPTPVFGDVTGDGSADIVTAGSDGNLYAHTVPGNTQATNPALSLSAVKANSPHGDSWADYQITHRGSLRGGGNVDDLIVHKPGDTALYYYQNPGNTGADGRFDTYNTIAKPACTASYCAGYATDWSTTNAILATGDISTTNLDTNQHFLNRTGLITEETNTSGDDALWFYPVISDDTLGPPVLLSPTGWKGEDLISPGDWDAQGHPGIWARNRTSGAIDAYTLTTTTGTTTDAFGDPITFNTLSGITHQSTIDTAITAAAYPVVGSDGDLTGDGIPDLWATTPVGGLQVWPGIATSSSAPLTGIQTTPIPAGSTTTAADEWPLAQTSSNPSGLQDTAAVNPVTTTGSVTWGTNHSATSNAAAVLNGSAALATAGPAMDTSQSYTVSAWVDLTTTGSSDQIVVGASGSIDPAFCLYYRGDQKVWSFMTTTSDGTPIWDSALSPSTGALAPSANTWTHLAGVYDATNHSLTLYVNGHMAGASAAATTFKAPGPLTIGALRLTGSTTLASPLTGSIADIRTYPQPLTPAQIANITSTS